MVEKGLSVPSYENKPELFDDLELLWNGYIDLNAGRTNGMSINPISSTDILLWLELYKYTGDNKRIAFEILRKVDVSVTQYLNKKAKIHNGR